MALKHIRTGMLCGSAFLQFSFLETFFDLTRTTSTARLQGQLTMSHDDVIVMCKLNLHDVFVTWHFSVVSDIIFRGMKHVACCHEFWYPSCSGF